MDPVAALNSDPVAGFRSCRLFNWRDEEPQPPKDFQLSIDDMFEGVVMRMLAKRPEDRFQEPADMVQELERIAKFQNLEV